MPSAAIPVPSSVQFNAKSEIRSHLRKLRLVETSEERMHQEYVRTLVNEYAYSLDQMAEETRHSQSRSAMSSRDKRLGLAHACD